MLLLIILAALSLSVISIVVFRKSSTDAEKIGFVCGIISLVSFPFGVLGVLVSAFNIQGIFNHLTGWGIFSLVWLISILLCGGCLINHLADKPANNEVI